MTIPTPYEDALWKIIEDGDVRPDRTGTGTKGLFGMDLRYDLSKGFPLLTTKKVFTKGIIHELLWFLRGDTNIGYLTDNGVHIWDEWADEDGELGPVYGHQWIHWDSAVKGERVAGHPYKDIDQIQRVINSILDDPHGRRHIVTAWNPSDLEAQKLPPCHMMFQFYVSGTKLSCKLTQRSADMFLGVPFNIASYALLTHMVAAQTGYDVGDLIWSGGDCHIYLDHYDQVREQLTRAPRPYPTLKLAPRISIFDYVYEDIEIVGYDPHPPIKAKVSA